MPPISSLSLSLSKSFSLCCVSSTDMRTKDLCFKKEYRSIESLLQMKAVLYAKDAKTSKFILKRRTL